MNKLIVTVFLFSPLFIFSQNCNCKSNFDWVKRTFEENDAGFSYVIENKGKQAYERHTNEFVQKVKNSTNAIKCNETIYKWLTFFRSGHIAIRNLDQGIKENTTEKNKNERIIEKYKNTEKIAVNLKEFTGYLHSKKKVDYEGIWVLESYKIGVKKVNNVYIGFIIEADGIYWREGQIKFKINPDNSSVYYRKDHSKRVYKSTELFEGDYLQIGRILLKRMTPKFDKNPKIEQYYKTISAKKTYFKVIDDKTTYLRIPTFAGSEKNRIDSIVLANKEVITKTPNLIIDIRNNGGGNSASYEALLPILYTNPIRAFGIEMLSTPLNNQRMLDFINTDKYNLTKEQKKWAQESYDKLSKQIGSFVNLSETKVSEISYDTIHSYPKNIGVIIDKGNASAAEGFIVEARQSSKVKLFGTTTGGFVDISNMYFVKSPCKELELGYSLSRNMRLPKMIIDGVGIQPDHYLDDSIPKYEWIEFVTKSLAYKATSN